LATLHQFIAGLLAGPQPFAADIAAVKGLNQLQFLQSLGRGFGLRSMGSHGKNGKKQGESQTHLWLLSKLTLVNKFLKSGS
jgi:hypothetical protein